VALLFSPESILQEEAVRLIARSDIKLYRSVYNRIPVVTRKRLDRIINKETDIRDLLFEKIQFLTGRFEGIIEDELLLLSKSLLFFNDIKTFMSSIPEGYILWALTDGNNGPSVRILFTSGTDELFEKVNGSEKSPVYILPFRAIDEFLYQYPDDSGIILTYFENNENIVSGFKL